jgi:D-alanyl-lipoteichoic acid acyltransferase DltB (MBOAT superfamily)
MLFQSLQFLLLLVPVLFANALLSINSRTLGCRKILLVGASAVFYMSWNVPLYGLLVLSIALNYFVARRIQTSRARRRVWLALGVGGQLAILALFKYANFGIESAALLLENIGLPTRKIVLDIVLPLGISFYTFQAMGYVIDVYRKRYKAYDSFLDFFLFISFFPQLVAGPIVRADFFRRKLEKLNAPVTLPMLSSGLFLFITGVFKKVALADNAANIANLVFSQPGELGGLLTLLGIYAFAFQIYFDFSGYTDMARGLGRMFGIELPINFNLPYLARGLREFWQRWHISLSSWLRDYLYISLGGARGSALMTYRNLMITMLLGGLWHGASFNFVVWGGIHGLLLAVEHATLGKAKRVISSPLWNALVIALTFHVVCFAWIFFRAQSFDGALAILWSLFDAGSYLAVGELGLFKPQNWLFGAILPALWIFGAEKKTLSNEIGFEMRSPLRRATAFTGMLFLILLVAGKTNEFIYFQF